MITKKYLENLIFANNELIKECETRLTGIKNRTISFNGSHAELMMIKNKAEKKIKVLKVENNQCLRMIENEF